MRNFIITTDSTADLPKDYIKEHKIALHPLCYVIDDITYGDGVNELSPKDFYQAMRDGKVPTTNASNPEFITNLMEQEVCNGYDILHISFSSALSSSYNNACICANQVMEDHPEATILVVDSRAATLGQGLLVIKAIELKEEGKSLQEVADWITENRGNCVHEFTVDDLFHLHRGGRVSKSTAVVGSIINIKPILHVNDKGELIPLTKVRGRKKVLSTFVNDMKEKTKDCPTDTALITHADCIEDANTLANLLREEVGVTNILIEDMCPTIGAHTGPGALALFYMGSHR